MWALPQYLTPKHPWYHLLMTDFSQTSGYQYYTSLDTSMLKKSLKRNSTVTCANTPTDRWVIIIIFSFHHYFFAYCQTFARAATIIFAIQQKVWTHETVNCSTWFTLDSHVSCWVLGTAGLLPWVQESPAQLRHHRLVDLQQLELTHLRNVTPVLKIFKANSISGKSSTCQHRGG